MTANALAEAVVLVAGVLEEGGGHGVVLVARALKVAQVAAGCDIFAEDSELSLVVGPTRVTQRPGKGRRYGERLHIEKNNNIHTTRCRELRVGGHRRGRRFGSHRQPYRGFSRRGR